MNDRAIRHRRLGRELRRLRREADLTAQHAADAVGLSKSMMSLFETGGRVPQSAQLTALLDLYGANKAQQDGVMRLFDEAKRRDWLEEYEDIFSSPFRDYVSLEPEARSIHLYEPQYVPGLLQTEAYTRSMISADPVTYDVVDRLVRFRMERQVALRRDEPPHCETVIDESALLRPVGGSTTLREQLRSLVQAAARPNITIQVLPYEAIVFAGGPFAILRLPDPGAMDAVYLENLAASRFVEKPADIRTYGVVFERLRRTALDPAASVERISKAVEELDAHGDATNC